MAASLWLVGLLAGAIGLEALIAWRLRAPLYEWRDTEISLGLAAGWAASGIAMAFLTGLADTFTYQHRVLELGQWAGAPILAFLLADLAYYLWHRLSHRWPLMWASHFPHHTAKRINFLASVRQGWTDVFSGTWLTWALLGFLGFSPLQLAPYFIALLLVQLLAHNEWTPRLGVLDWVLVTPSNHRVHHGLDGRCVDKNFGGLLIIWDRLFGTYEAEGAARLHDFGLVGFDADAASPAAIATHGWRAMVARRRPVSG